jgi:hypothetical protein
VIRGSVKPGILMFQPKSDCQKKCHNSSSFDSLVVKHLLSIIE